MKFEEANLRGVKILTPPTIFEDFRGEYVELYNKRLYEQAGVGVDFIQDDISVSRKNVLRGIHGDDKTWKLISCLYGSFYLLVVNNIADSPDFKKWQAFNLSDRNRLQVLVPPGFGNGHVVMTSEAIFHYKQTTEYDRAGQFTITWNDPEYNFWWPTNDPIVSERDEGIS